MKIRDKRLRFSGNATVISCPMNNYRCKTQVTVQPQEFCSPLNVHQFCFGIFDGYLVMREKAQGLLEERALCYYEELLIN